jgi:hypothetical protein
MAYKPQFQGALPYSWGQKGYTQQPERMEQPNVFGSTLPPAWMLPPKMTTLEEQQMEIPEFQELTKKKEALAGLKNERQKAIDERIKIYQDELEKADTEFGSLAARPDNFYSMSYKDKKNKEQKFIDARDRVSQLRTIISQLQYNPEKEIQGLKEQRKKLLEDKNYKSIGISDPATEKKAFLQRLDNEIRSKKELYNDPTTQSIFQKQNEELLTDINARFKDSLEAANKEQAAALAKFEEAKKRVKYRPPAGVALDERGVPITA